MKVLAVFLVYLVGALLLGALLSYPMYLLLDSLAEVRFHKVVSRAGLLIALLGLPLLVRYLGVDSRQALGYQIPFPTFSIRVVVGWLLGILILLVPSCLLVALNVRILEPDLSLSWEEVLGITGKAMVSGLLVALIEETLFRGAVYGAIARRHTVGQAVVISSLLYAAVHFIKPLPVSSTETLTWTHGVTTMGQAFWPFAEAARFADAFLALFVAGVFLSLVRRYSGHIAYCVGLHAGWVTVIKVTKHFTDRNPDSSLFFLVGAYDGITGLLAAGWVAVLCLIYWTLMKRRQS